MADKQLPSLTALTPVADGDLLYIVDISDTTDSDDGTSKKIAKSELVTDLSLTDISDVTASVAEVNILNGATLTGTELNQLDGNAFTDDINLTAGKELIIGTDTNLFRNDANSLMTDDTFVVGSGVLNVGIEDSVYGILTLQPAGTGNSEGGKVLYGIPADFDTSSAYWVQDVFEDDLRFFTSDGSNSFFRMKADGKFQFGSDGDTNLYRSAANTLKTDDAFIATGKITTNADSVQIDTTQSPLSNGAGTVGEIAWDADYLYVCTSANTWKRATLTGGY